MRSPGARFNFILLEVTTSQLSIMKKHKILLAVIFVAVFVAGLMFIVANKSIGLNDLVRSIQDMSPRVMSLMALPIIALLFVLGVFLRRKSEERKWKKALLKTRAKRRD